MSLSRLAAHDGTELAYRVVGTGSPMVLTNGLTTSTLFWKYLEPRWARDHRFLAWDLPGHGQSGPARTTASARIAEQPEHVVQLMDAVGMSRAVQVGWSTGCQVVLELYRRYPERCSALVLLLGSAGRVLSTTRLLLPGTVIESLVRYAPRRLFGAALRGMALAGRAPFGQTLPRRARLIGRETSREDALLITQHLGRLHAPTVQTMVASAEEHSAWEILGDIQIPVLIVAGDRDPFAPAETVGVRMHAACPNSELVRLRRATHTALLDHADAIAAAVDAFVERRVVPARE